MKGLKVQKTTIDLSAFFQVFLKYLKFLCKQITFFIGALLSDFQCCFRKGFGAQNCLLAMLEHWKTEVDKRQVFGALLTDLSKDYDSLSHELIK